jgi:hypothetical protein
MWGIRIPGNGARTRRFSRGASLSTPHPFSREASISCNWFVGRISNKKCVLVVVILVIGVFLKDFKKEKTLKRKLYSLKFTHALEHLHPCSVCDPANIFCTCKFSYLLFFKLQPHTSIYEGR